MMNHDQIQNTPSGGTRSNQVAKVISESDSLLWYCTRFLSSTSEENFESLLKIKNKSL